MPQPTSRTSPLTRTPRRYPLAMIEHGQDILQLLVTQRFATGSQIQRAIFDRQATSPRMARHRATRSLRRLFDTGLLRRVSVYAPSSTGRMSRQVVNVLSAAGAQAVGMDPRKARTRAPKPDAILTHEFWLVELAILAIAGCPAPLAVETWMDDRVLLGRKRLGLLHLPTVPDAYMLVRNRETGKAYPCLLELDLGSESVASPSGRRHDIARKIEGYLEYLGGDFRSDFDIDAPPIVLIVTDSERRLRSIRATTQRLGGGGRYWFVTLDRLGGKDGQDTDSTALQGAFWGLNWLTASEGGLRSLAARCGV